MRIVGFGSSYRFGAPLESESKRIYRPAFLTEDPAMRGMTPLCDPFEHVTHSMFGTARRPEGVIVGGLVFLAMNIAADSGSNQSLGQPRIRFRRADGSVTYGRGHWHEPGGGKTVQIPEALFLALATATPGVLGAAVGALNTLASANGLPGAIGLSAKLATIASGVSPVASSAPYSPTVSGSSALPAPTKTVPGVMLLRVCAAVPWLNLINQPSHNHVLVVSIID